MNPQSEEIRKTAINDLLNADSFVCITINDGKLNMATLINPERLGIMLLEIMRSNPAFANSVNLATLAYAREQLHHNANSNQQ